ncbi:MAG: Peptidase M48, Ste24p precursor, partial [uncultured Gemmatimonadaceae bacterium]
EQREGVRAHGRPHRALRRGGGRDRRPVGDGDGVAVRRRHELRDVLGLVVDGAAHVRRAEDHARRRARAVRDGGPPAPARRAPDAHGGHRPARPAQRLRHGAQPRARGGVRDRGDHAPRVAGRARGGDRARAGAHQEPRHAAADDHGHPGRRHQQPGLVRDVRRRQRRRGGWKPVRRADRRDRRAHRGLPGADGDQPAAGVQGRRGGGRDLRPPARPGQRAAEAGGRRAADPDARRAGGGPARPGKPARRLRRRDGQAVLHPPAHRGARGPVGGDGGV